MTISPSTRVLLSSAFVSLGCGLFGFDTGSIGAVTLMPAFEELFGVLSPMTRGITVACILVPSALSGMVAGSISDAISRKRTIALGAFIFCLGSAMSTGATHLAGLIVGRCIAGAGEGLLLSASAVYVCETSPARLRGRMLCVCQLFITSGIAVGFFTCYASVKITDSSLSWRLPFAISTFTALVLAIGCLSSKLVYSPRWLMLKGRRLEAEAVLDLIAGTSAEDVEERRELLGSRVDMTEASKFTDIFSKGVRGRTFLGAFLNVFQQLSGIDFVLYYSPLLFVQAGLELQSASFFASGVTGLLLVASTLAGTLYIEAVNRRTLFLVGAVAQFSCLFSLGSMYYTGAAKSEAGKWICVALIEVFALSFNMSWALVVRLYATECQPLKSRASASSFGQGANQAVNFVVAVTGPVFLAASTSGPYFLYGSFTCFAFFVAYFLMIETRGKSLESIETSFEGSPYAVSWNEMFRSSASQARMRRASRTGSSNLPAEARGEFKSNLVALDMIGSTIQE